MTLLRTQELASKLQTGLKGILVKTGKYRQSYAEASTAKPDLIIDSIMDLPGVLGF